VIDARAFDSAQVVYNMLDQGRFERKCGFSGVTPVLYYFNVDTGAVKLAVVKGMDENIETRP
jgi:hypothetical protein